MTSPGLAVRFALPSTDLSASSELVTGGGGICWCLFDACGCTLCIWLFWCEENNYMTQCYFNSYMFSLSHLAQHRILSMLQYFLIFIFSFFQSFLLPAGLCVVCDCYAFLFMSQGSCLQSEEHLSLQINLSERGDRPADLDKLKPYVIEHILVLLAPTAGRGAVGGLYPSDQMSWSTFLWDYDSVTYHWSIGKSLSVRPTQFWHFWETKSEHRFKMRLVNFIEDHFKIVIKPY